jgi:hypothetical protein
LLRSKQNCIGSDFIASDKTQTHYAYRSNGDFIFVKMPNVHGYLPKSVVNEAFHAAELPLPDWNVFWGD